MQNAFTYSLIIGNILNSLKKEILIKILACWCDNPPPPHSCVPTKIISACSHYHFASCFHTLLALFSPLTPCLSRSYIHKPKIHKHTHIHTESSVRQERVPMCENWDLKILMQPFHTWQESFITFPLIRSCSAALLTTSVK